MSTGQAELARHCSRVRPGLDRIPTEEIVLAGDLVTADAIGLDQVQFCNHVAFHGFGLVWMKGISYRIVDRILYEIVP